jgi:ACS family allantoate permease-like MFS transporter
MLSILSLYLLFLTRNRKRAAENALSAEHIAEGQMRGLSDETDLKNPNFKVSPRCNGVKRDMLTENCQ